MIWYLKHKYGTEQEVEYIYGPFTEEGGFEGTKRIQYSEPMAVVQLVGVDIKKPWSVKTQPVKYLLEK